jgi:hypothetical protein
MAQSDNASETELADSRAAVLQPGYRCGTPDSSVLHQSPPCKTTGFAQVKEPAS